MTSSKILFVHGLASSYANNWERNGWPDVIGELGYEAVGFSLPGHIGAIVDAGDDDAALDALLEVAADNDIDTAVGFSAGSLMLLRSAARNPTRFARLALLGVGDGMWNDGAGLRAIADAFEQPGTIADPGLAFMAKTAVAAGNDPGSIARFVRAVPRQPDAQALASIAAQVLVILGDRDDVGPADTLVSSLRRAELVTLAGTDHFATSADYRALAAVADFLRAPVSV
ncbi:alpha/beta fold hydrolase [Rhodococcus cercidiphylli]|uniref:Alpha/beta hydrolase n=1 Tax=Rhodococcus cercidiphylli TaxID=489916 RepID=A0ABU4AWE8_9NOCA|nr:alpha/beta hydrolase [Rhodococcus cercidiphylli]MDV6230561.1 alpha/beta hydrolase [Rhodococcus cercidiphylli]